MGTALVAPIAIIGSGPSGVAVRWALEEEGCNFEILDTNLMEDNYFATTPTAHSRADTKLKLGSDIPYRQFPYGPSIQYGNTKMKSSFTAGGLSEVWGATLLPYQKETISAWGLQWPDFIAAYKKILRKIPYSTYQINPKSVFEDFGNPKKLEINAMFNSALNIETDRKKIEFGASRLAVRVSDNESPGCYFCNRCLEGCSSGHIWSAAQESPEKSLSEVKIKSGIRVIKIEERSREIFIHAVTSSNELIEIGPYSKVFLACGPIETFRILSTSELLSRETNLQDSPTFFFPLLFLGKRIEYTERGVALSQAYCHIQGAQDKSEYHFQFYAHSEMLLERMLTSIPLARFFPKELFERLTRRIVICIGYRQSGKDTEITLTRDPDDNLKCKDSYQISRFKLKSDLRKRLFLHSLYLWRAQFLFPGLGIKVGAAGEGVHYGANLKQDIDLTKQGRLIGSKAVYVVDSSSLQSIAAGPITLTIMANSYRITKEALK